MFMATMREIATQAGVSLKTVSRVYNQDPHVRAELRQRVERLLAENDYVPNELAQTFRSGKERVIGIAVPDLLDPFFAAIAASVSEEARKRGYGTLVTATGFDPADERRDVRALLARRLAGLVIAPVSADQSYLPGQVPVVLVDQPASGVSVDSFVHEDRSGARVAIQHLLGHGFRRIGFMGRASHLATTQERLAGYRQALSDANIPLDETLVIPDVDAAVRAQDAYTRLRRSGIDALFTADPRTTIACLPAMQQDRVAVVGFGDFPLADLLTPSISVVDQSPKVMGSRAGERLFDLIELDAATTQLGAAAGETVRLPVRLVERQSCR
jgi:LacI family transcriptional regulator